jgi:hypothetical protein
VKWLKKVIGRKVYDTETAELLGHWDNDYPKGDMKYVVEKLYKTKKGAYFLYGSGGPMTQYAVPCGSNTTSGSSEITPMTKEEAANWAEKHCNKLFDTEFSDQVEEA